MAEVSKFFNSGVDDPRYHYASDFADYFGRVLSAGLLLDENEEYGLQVTLDSGLSAVVSTGLALIKGYAYENTTPLTLQHSIPETDNDRIDRVVLRLDLRNQSRFIKVFIKEGVSSSTPVVPELQRDEYIYELSLAQVTLRANTSSIDVNDMLDERALEDVCGIVQSLITVPTSVFQQQFNEWFDGQKDYYENEMADWQAGSQADFNAWFQSIKDILDGDVAANLASRIATLESVVATHVADIASQEVGKGADLVGLPDDENNFTATNVGGAMQELFTNVSDGKNLLKPTIIDKGGKVEQVGDTPTFEELNSGIDSIQTGGMVIPDGTNLDYEVISAMDKDNKIYTSYSLSSPTRLMGVRIYDGNTMLLLNQIEIPSTNIRGATEDGYTILSNPTTANIYTLEGTLIHTFPVSDYITSSIVIYRQGNLFLQSNATTVQVRDTNGLVIKYLATNFTNPSNLMLFLNKKRNVIISEGTQLRVQKITRVDVDLNTVSIQSNFDRLPFITDIPNW